MSETSNDEQDMAEALDSDHLGTPDDPDVEPDFPAEEPLGVDEYGLTAAEEQVGEPLDERVARETPDPLLQELDGSGSPAAQEESPGDASVPAEEAALHLDAGASVGEVDPVVDLELPPDEDRPPR